MNHFLKYLLILGLTLSLLILISAFKPFSGLESGLDSPSPIGPFLNRTLPSVTSQGDIQSKRVFPNLTFDSPITFAVHPRQNQFFIGQRNGLVYSFENDQNVEEKNVFLDISHRVGLVQDGGFLGLALHPNFGKENAHGSRYFYTYYATRDSSGGHQPNQPIAANCSEEHIWYGGYLILSRWEVEDDSLKVKANSELIMVKTRLYNSVHRGGGLAFGNDGMLYCSVGDQGQYRAAQQMEDNFNGGVFRIDVDMDNSRSHTPTWTLPKDPKGPDEMSGVGYFIPNSNPFNHLENTLEEYYALGFRNPYRLTSDPLTGNIFVGDIGSWLHEEINKITPGFNGGWPVWEGDSAKKRCTDDLYPETNHHLPLVAFPRKEASAIIGGYVYRGAGIPQLYGKYICADYGTGGEVFAIDPNTGEYEQLNLPTQINVIAFGQDNEDELYILREGKNRGIFKLELSEAGPNPPALLSEIDAFKNLEKLEPFDGLIPYDLNVPFWSDGAEKQRWMAIPNDGKHDNPEEKIIFSENGDWQFPIGSVLIKHFELGEKRLETRFLVHGEDSLWYGLTYKWREDGVDADLLLTGLDEEIQVNGESQIWHYPATNECLSCHTPAAGSALGPKTRQLNKEHFYPSSGRFGNQLATLNHLNIFSAEIEETDILNYLTSSPTEDNTLSLEDRARSYLDANCSYCHRPETGNRAGFDLRLSTELEAQNLVFGDLLDNLGIESAKGIVPMNPAKSMIHHRMSLIESGNAMPPLARNKVDEKGLKLIEDWINSMGKAEPISYEIKIYPNPLSSQENLHITIESYQIGLLELEIINLAGKSLLKQSVELESLIDEFEIEIDHLSAGVYLLRISDGETNEAKRFVVF